MRLRRRDDEEPAVEPWTADAPEPEAIQHVVVDPRSSRRGPIIMAAIVVVLLVLGLTVGGDDPQGAASPEDEEEDASTTTTSRPARTTTSSTSSTSTTEVLGQVLPTRVGVALLFNQRLRWVLVDLDTGFRREVELEGDPYQMVGLRNGVVIQREGGAWFTPLPEGESVRLGLADQLFGADDTSVWLVRPDASSSAGETQYIAEQITSGGKRVRGPIALPATWVVGATERGLITTLAGRTYLVDEDGPHLLGDGEARAARGRTVAVVVCDEQARCHPRLVDVRTGTVTDIELPDADTTTAAMDLAYDLSPDGEVLALISFGFPGPELTFFDRAGAELGSTDFSFGYQQPLQWVPGQRGFMTVASGGGTAFIHVVDGAVAVDELDPVDGSYDGVFVVPSPG